MTRALLIAGGGTGGHLFPGIAVAQEIRRRLPAQVEALFACTNRELDGAEIARYGFAARPLSTPRWRGSLSGLPFFALSLLDALAEAAELVRRVRPFAVVGLGGYGCAPPVFAAWRLGIPTLMLEQNVIPGRATRTLGPFVDSVCCQWSETVTALDSSLRRSLRAGVRRNRSRAGRDTANWLLHTGNPLRVEMTRMPVRAARQRFGLERASRVLLVLGGSQGSVALDEIAIRTVPMLHEAVAGLGVIHIAGARDREKVEKAYADTGVPASVHGFFREMPAAYSASDAALCRAGGTTIAELTKFGIPMALVPYPRAMDDHQTANARAVERAGAGFVFSESHLGPTALLKSLRQLLGDTRVLALMSARSLGLAFPDAAAQVADRLIELIRIIHKPSSNRDRLFARPG